MKVVIDATSSDSFLWLVKAIRFSVLDKSSRT